MLTRGSWVLVLAGIAFCTVNTRVSTGPVVAAIVMAVGAERMLLKRKQAWLHTARLRAGVRRGRSLR